MNFTKSLMVVALFAASASSVNAAEIVVKGSVTPGSCTPTVNNAGVMTYGTTNFMSTLNQTGVSTLADKSIQYQVVCQGSTKIAFKAIDTNNSPYPGYFGLGHQGTVDIGNYQLVFWGNHMADGANVRLLSTTNGGTSWTQTSANNAQLTMSNQNTQMVSYGTASATPAPGSFTNISGWLGITAVKVARADSFNPAIPLVLNGKATLELVYL